MRISIDCIPCLQRQALTAIKLWKIDEEKGEQILRQVMDQLLSADWSKTPPELAHEVHKIIRQEIGADPYAPLKTEYNKIALKLYDNLKKRISESDDSLETAVRLSIAGNIIDFGAYDSFDLEETIEKSLREGKLKDLGLLKKMLKSSKSLLYFLDNAGEIVFDRLLIEELSHETKFDRITLVAKGGPILNDATIDDIEQVGLTNYPVLFTGNGDEGTGPSRNSEEVKSWIEKHDLVLSKGQGNYEGLSDFPNVFFLLIAKCPLIASRLDVEEGTMILKYNSLHHLERPD